MFTPGSRACAYKTASGLGKWPNRDPLEEGDGPAIYAYTHNDAVDFADPLGLKCTTTRFDFELGKFLRYLISSQEEQQMGNIVFRAQITKCDACCNKGGGGFDAQVAAGVSGSIQTPKIHPISWAPFVYLQASLSANFNAQLNYKSCPNKWTGGGCGNIQLGGKVGVDRIIPPSWSIYGDISGGCTLCVKADQVSPVVHVTLQCQTSEQIFAGIRFGRRQYSYNWMWQQSTSPGDIASFGVE